MKISHKILFALLVPILMIVVGGAFAVNISQKALQKSIAEDTLSLAAEILDKIEREICGKIEIFQEYTKDLILQGTVERSNEAFADLADINAYLDQQHQEWSTVPINSVTPFMDGLSNNELAEELGEKMEFYREKYGYDLFGKIFVTNKYGAIAGQTARASGYRHDDEQWWQDARENGLSIEDITLDEGSGIYFISFAIRIDGEDGNFAGVIKVTLNIQNTNDIIKNLSMPEKHHVNPSRVYKLTTSDGRLIYSTSPYIMFSDISPSLQHFFDHDGRQSSYQIEEALDPLEGKKLIVHAHSKGYKDFAGLGWFLIIDYSTKEIFSPVIELKKRIIFVSLVLAILATLFSLLITQSIIRPIKELAVAVAEIGKGNFDIRLMVKSQDEIGRLTHSFNKMTASLQQTTTSVRTLEKEVLAHQKTEVMLRTSEQRFRSLIETTSDLVWEQDAEGAYTYLSPQIQGALGYSPEEILGKTTFDLMPSQDAGRVADAFAKVVASREPFSFLEIINLHKDGRQKFFEVNGVPVLDRDGVLKGYRGITRDITEKKQVEESLRHISKMEAVATLAGGVAHDFNTLLGTILGYCEMLEEHVCEDRRLAGYIEEMMRSGNLAKVLVKQLMDFARPDASTHRAVQLSFLVEETVNLLRGMLPATVTVKPQITSGSTTVSINFSQIEQVLMNLVMNAGDAIGQKGGDLNVILQEIEVDTEQARKHGVKRGAYLCLTITDTGCGMTADIIQHIFEPFFTTKEVGKGTGLGLAVVHGIVESHGGFITVSSAVGQGSSFAVFLPKIESTDTTHIS